MRPSRAPLPTAIWAPLAALTLMLAPGVIGLLAGLPALFPSLGPTAVTQAYTPRMRSARFYSVVVSHLGGLAAGILVVLVFGLGDTPSVFEIGTLTLPRVLAAAAAVTVATWLEGLLRSKHPPAASTTLLVALGSFRPTLHDVSVVVLGVLTVAVLGEALRRLRVRDLERAEGVE